MSQKKSITRNAFARILMYTLNLLVPVLVGPYLARVLDVDLYAEYNISLSILQWFLPFAIFGIYAYGMRQASRERDNPGKTTKVFSQLFLLGIISTTIVWICYMTFVLVTKVDYFWLYLLVGIQIIANYFAVEWINEAFENYTFILYKTALVRIGYIVSIFIFVKTPDDILPFAVIASLVLFVNNILGFWYIKRKVPFVHVSIKELKVLLKPLLMIMILTNANMLFLMLDRLYLSAFSGVNVYITYYTFSQLIMMAVMNVISSIMYVTVPRLSNYLFTKNRNEYNNLLNISAHSFFLFAIPICAGIAALGPEIMYLYAGDSYIGAGSTLVIFGLCFIINAVDLSLSNQVLFVNGMEKKLIRIYLVAGGLNVVFDTVLVLTNQLTPILLISTTAICYLVVILLQHFTIQRELGKGISPLDRTTIKYIGISLCFIPIAVGFRRLFNVTLTLNKTMLYFLLVVIGVCVVFYVLLLYCTHDLYFLKILYSIKDKIVKVLSKGKGVK